MIKDEMMNGERWMEMKTEKKERAKKRDSKFRRPGLKKKKGRLEWSGLSGEGERLTITESRGESRRNGRGWEKI